ncbi:MAG TPA: acyl carrier protein [Candidatus Udaeobacter sp.]|jgi:acyl carrier protein|nr:acyl carrier protein [Candidatus Udaeobacter sp.]
MEIPTKLKQFIDDSRGSLPAILDPDEPLQLDSLGLVRLVAFLEIEFHYRIEDADLNEENFATMRKLGELLGRKTPGVPMEVKHQVESGIPTFSARREKRKRRRLSSRGDFRKRSPARQNVTYRRGFPFD